MNESVVRAPLILALFQCIVASSFPGEEFTARALMADDTRPMSRYNQICDTVVDASQRARHVILLVSVRGL